MASDYQLRQWYEPWKCRKDPSLWTTHQFYHVTVPIPRVAGDAYEALEQTLRYHAYNPSGADTGTYVCRNIDWKPDSDPTAVPSQHSYGTAIDFDWFDNPDGPAGSNPWSGDLTKVQIDAVYAIKNTQGERIWTWGGYWRRVDRMHFQLDVPPSRLMVDWSTVPKEVDMALPKEVEDFVMQMYNGVKAKGSNGFFVEPTIDLVRAVRETPYAPKTHTHPTAVPELPAEVEATIRFK